MREYWVLRSKGVNERSWLTATFDWTTERNDAFRLPCRSLAVLLARYCRSCDEPCVAVHVTVGRHHRPDCALARALGERKEGE